VRNLESPNVAYGWHSSESILAPEPLGYHAPPEGETADQLYLWHEAEAPLIAAKNLTTSHIALPVKTAVTAVP
jgi:hypothetical protein